jgi:hypothetical protein
MPSQSPVTAPPTQDGEAMSINQPGLKVLSLLTSRSRRRTTGPCQHLIEVRHFSRWEHHDHTGGPHGSPNPGVIPDHSPLRRRGWTTTTPRRACVVPEDYTRRVTVPVDPRFGDPEETTVQRATSSTGRNGTRAARRRRCRRCSAAATTTAIRPRQTKPRADAAAAAP